MAFRLWSIMHFKKERKLIHGSGATEEGYKRKSLVMSEKVVSTKDRFESSMSSSEVAEGELERPPTSILPVEAIVQTLLDELNPRGTYLAAIRMSISIAPCGRERITDKKELEIVKVLPSLHAGGRQLAAFKYFMILLRWNLSQPKPG